MADPLNDNETVRTLIALTLKEYAEFTTATFYAAVVSSCRHFNNRLRLCLERTFGDVIDKLLYNVQTLFHLVYTVQQSGVAITFRTYNFIELNFVIGCIRLTFTNVIVPT